MGRILAIDYGRKRSGIAVTDEMQLIASLLTSLPSFKVLEFLWEYMTHEKVDCVVIGEPRTLNNQASEAVIYIEPFVKELRKKFPDLLIERMDERFTSKIASEAILRAGLSKKARRDKSLVDGVSAVLILQSWLEQTKMKASRL